LLILTRKLGESIAIGDNIKISVLGIHGRQVRIGIEAPPEIIVHREEIYLKVQEENRNASKSIKDDLMGVVRMLKEKFKGQSSSDQKPFIGYKKNKPRKKRNNFNDKPRNNR